MIKKLFKAITNFLLNTKKGAFSTSAQDFDKKIHHYLTQKNIHLDTQQEQALHTLRKLYQLLHQTKKHSTNHCGIYLWGNVGTGKTLLMDMLYHITDIPKIRLHHHELFKKLMNDLHLYKTSAYPLETSIEVFTKHYQLACFDDLHLNDIADAKLWQGVFEQAKKNGLFMFITSNTHPSNLMDTPGYREKIKPLLSMMQTYLIITQVDAGVDYRSQQQHHKITTHSACLPEDKLDTLYYQLTQQTFIPHNSQQLTIQNRQLTCHSYHNDTIFFTLEQLCSTTRSYTDYIEICEKFQCITIIKFTSTLLSHPLSLQRFIWLIDIVYDTDIKFFVISELNPIETLHKQEHPDIKRTISRLKQIL